MRFPSLQNLVSGARASVARFPLVVVAAVTAAVAGIIDIHASPSDALIRLLLTAQLGIPFFFALDVAGETHRWPRSMRLGVGAAGVVALAAYYWTLPERMLVAPVTRFIELNVGVHLLVSFVPFTTRGRLAAFWQYNKTLFLQFLTAALYSVVMFAGLAIALLAVDKLLGLSVSDDTYGRLWIFIAFVFNTLVFLSGVPRDILGLERAGGYPRGLKVFAQYILMPLVVVYLAILTIYFVKVVVTTVWPSGWIGYLVSSVAVVGILALLLIHPVAENEENRWVATFSRWYFLVMAPSIVMLLLAIGRRIDQYGFTERRYLLLVLSVWLAVTAAWFVSSRRRSIKWFPVTLCLLAFVTSFGPWGAYSVSRRSQLDRLESLLARNHMIENGSVHAASGEVPLDDRREISAILHYMVETHGVGALHDRFAVFAAADSAAASHSSVEIARGMAATIGIEYVGSQMDRMARAGTFHYTMGVSERVLPVDGADYFVLLQGTSCALPDSGYQVARRENPPRIELRRGGAVLASVAVDSVLARIEAAGYEGNPRAIPPELVRGEATGDDARLVVYLTGVSGKHNETGYDVKWLTAYCLVNLPADR